MLLFHPIVTRMPHGAVSKTTIFRLLSGSAQRLCAWFRSLMSQSRFSHVKLCI